VAQADQPDPRQPPDGRVAAGAAQAQPPGPVGHDVGGPQQFVTARGFDDSPDLVERTDGGQSAGDRGEVLFVLGARLHDDALCTDLGDERRELTQQVVRGREKGR
jgi:hypothetical protein